MIKQTLLWRMLRKFYFEGIRIPLAYHWTRQLHILDAIQSLDYIAENKCSVGRFGDGEFDVIRGGGNGFQRPDKKLGEALTHVLTATDAPNFMVAIPLPIKNTEGLRNPKIFWPYVTLRCMKLFKQTLSTSRLYLNTQLSRFYFEREDRSQCGGHLAKIKRLWEGRDVVLVEGVKTRSGVGNDLYANARSLKRILGPAEDAFDKYEEMLATITKHAAKDQLILLSYGMTATVLAYDLAKLGYQAIDLGHVDIEYEWFLRGCDGRESIPGKYTNETEGRDVPPCDDPEYLSQIIADIS